MLVRICCPCIRQNPIYKNVRCNRYLGEVDGRYHFKCDRCKGVIEGATKEGWVKIIHPPEKRGNDVWQEVQKRKIERIPM